MAIDCSIGRALIEATGFDPRNPRALSRFGNIADHVAPILAAVACDLNVSVIGANPNELAVLGRLGDGVNRCVHLRRGVIDGNAAGLFLLLLLRIVRAQIRRDTLPRLSVIARTEEELGSQIESVLVVGAYLDRSVPVEAQLLLSVLRVGFDGARLMGPAIHAPNLASLSFGVDVVTIGWVFPHPEAVAAVHVFPTRIAHAAGIRRVADPRTVVLQSAVNVIGNIVIDAYVIELRDRQVYLVLPARAAIEAAPQTSVVRSEDDVGVIRIDPDIVEVAVRLI